MHSVAGDNLSEEGEHADASILDLHEPEAVELFLVASGNESEGIKESER